MFTVSIFDGPNIGTCDTLQAAIAQAKAATMRGECVVIRNECGDILKTFIHWGHI